MTSKTLSLTTICLLAYGGAIFNAQASPTSSLKTSLTPEKFHFKYNLHKSLPDAWVTEFKKKMDFLEELLPITSNINQVFTDPFMNVYAWKTGETNPFPEKPGISGSSISGSSMILEMSADSFSNGDVQRVVHEYFHVYQIGLSKDAMMPKWLVEGGANAFEEIDYQQYEGKRALDQELENNVSKYVFTNPKLFEKYQTSSNDPAGKQMDINYGSSTFMVLALVKELRKQGISEQRAFEMVFRDFWIENSKQRRISRENLEWEKSFETVFKISIETFYSRLMSKYTHAGFKEVLPSKTLEVQQIFVAK